MPAKIVELQQPSGNARRGRADGGQTEGRGKAEGERTESRRRADGRRQTADGGQKVSQRLGHAFAPPCPARSLTLAHTAHLSTRARWAAHYPPPPLFSIPGPWPAPPPPSASRHKCGGFPVTHYHPPPLNTRAEGPRLISHRVSRMPRHPAGQPPPPPAPVPPRPDP